MIATTTITTTTTAPTVKNCYYFDQDCLFNEDRLFDDKYLSKEVQNELHDGYKLCPLRANDYERGYLDVLSVLTEVGAHTIESWNSQFQFMKKHNDTCKWI